MKNRAEPPGKPCAGSDKSLSERIEAIAAVGKSVELATSLKEGIEALSGVGRPPVAPHRPGFDLDAWRTLAAYLIEERRLIEFLLGPSVVGNQGSNLRYRNPDDHLPLCFLCVRTRVFAHIRPAHAQPMSRTACRRDGFSLTCRSLSKGPIEPAPIGSKAAAASAARTLPTSRSCTTPPPVGARPRSWGNLIGILAVYVDVLQGLVPHHPRSAHRSIASRRQMRMPSGRCRGRGNPVSLAS